MQPGPGSFTLDEQLCFALHSASRAIAAHYRDGLDALGLTYSQYTVMLVLWEHGPVTLGFLEAQVHLDSGTLSPLLKRLEKQGLVTRRRRAEDERVLEIVSTRAGDGLRDGARDVQARVECDTGLDRTELVRMRSDLTRLAAHLRRTTPGERRAS